MQTSAVPLLYVEDLAAVLKCTEETVRERAVELGGLKFGRLCGITC